MSAEPTPSVPPHAAPSRRPWIPSERVVGWVAALTVLAAGHGALRRGTSVVVEALDQSAQAGSGNVELPYGGLFEVWLLLSLGAAGLLVLKRLGVVGRRRWAALGQVAGPYLLFRLAVFGEASDESVQHAQVAPGFYSYKPGARIGVGPAGLETTVNNQGFRGPDFERLAPPGVLRGVVLGDSYAFGYCLRDADTLAVQLQSGLQRASPRPKVEVLNLGIMGTSLHGYVTSYEVAARDYKPDFTVLALRTPGDYSRFDFQDHWNGIHTWSAYALGGFIVGIRPMFYFLTQANYLTAPPPGFEAWTQGQADRIRAAREASHAGGPFVVLSWTDPSPPLVERLSADPGVSFVSNVLQLPADNCASNDEHPSAAAVKRVAQQLADHLQASPSYQAAARRRADERATP